MHFLVSLLVPGKFQTLAVLHVQVKSTVEYLSPAVAKASSCLARRQSIFSQSSEGEDTSQSVTLLVQLP